MGLFYNIDIAAVLVSTIVGFFIGMLWYSPLFFGNRWMILTNITKKEIEKSIKKEGMVKSLISTFIAVLITALVLNVLVVSLIITTPIFAIKLGVLLWVGFIATTFLNAVIYEKQPMELYFIKTSHYLVALILMSLIMSIMIF